MNEMNILLQQKHWKTTQNYFVWSTPGNAKFKIQVNITQTDNLTAEYTQFGALQQSANQEKPG